MTHSEQRGAVADLLARAGGAQREADDLIARNGAPMDATARSHALIRRCYPANALGADWARAAVTRLVQDALPRARVEAVRLAVGEAVASAVTRAENDAPRLVHFIAGLRGRELIVLVAEDGCGPRLPSCRAAAARGWTAIASTTDRFAISQRANGGTFIEMRWSLTAAARQDVPPALVPPENTLPPPSFDTSPRIRGARRQQMPG